MIIKNAITHIPLSQYAFANSEYNMTIRIRCAKDNIERCTLFYGDRVQPSDPIVFTPLTMEKKASDNEFDYFEKTFDTPYNRVCYYFELKSGDETAIMFSDIFANQPPIERSEFYQYPFIMREEVSDVPNWLKKATVYNIFPDSFANGKREIKINKAKTLWENGIELNSRIGGTINGIAQNLDYIKDQGFNCIYLNPIFTAAEYHKYDLLDYYHISPNLGTDGEFKQLVEQAHSLGMRVIIDGVFNHCSWYFFAFDDVVKNGENSRYKDWFYSLKFPIIRPQDETEKPSYSSFAYERKMPKLNTSHPEVKAYFADVCAHWIKNFDVDGFRLDVANEVDKDFWRLFKKTGRDIKPDSVMIGEIWESSETWLKGDMFDSTMNYDFRRYCRDFFALQSIDAVEFASRVTKMNYRYPSEVVKGQLNLLDSHDVNRFYSYCGGDIRKLRLAELFLFTSQGVPSVFYGDELGMDGNSEFELRAAMPWDKPNQDEREFFKQLAKLRNDNEPLVFGDMSIIHADKNGLLIYERKFNEKTMTIAMNCGRKDVEIGEYIKSKNVVLQSDARELVLSEMGFKVFKG